MSLYSLTKEKIEELKTKIESKRLQIEILQKLTIEDLWIADLDKFADIYKKDLRGRDISTEGRPDPVIHEKRKQAPEPTPIKKL